MGRSPPKLIRGPYTQLVITDAVQPNFSEKSFVPYHLSIKMSR